MLRFHVFLLLAGSATVFAQTQPDAEGCKDSSVLSRMPGCYISDCKNSEFDSFEMPVAKDDVKKAVAGQMANGYM